MTPRMIRLSLVLLPGLCFTALAQELLSPLMENPNQPVISQEDIDALKTLSSLTPEQYEFTNALLDGFNAASQALGRKAQRGVESVQMRHSNYWDQKARAEYLANTRKTRAGTIELERGLINDLLDLLTPDQRNAWPEFEKHRRLRVLLPQAQRPLVGVNLVPIVKDILKPSPPPPPPAANDAPPEKTDSKETAPPSPKPEKPPPLPAATAEMVTKYEDEVDAALVARKSIGMYYYRWSDEERMKPYEEQVKRYDAVRDADKRLFDIQQKYIKLFAQTMPEEKAAQFQTKIRKTAFGWVYSPSKRRNRIAEAMKVEGLTGEQVASIKQMAATTDARLEPIQNEFYEQWMRTEFRRTMKEEDMGQGYPDWEAYRSKRRAAEQETLDRALAMLSNEQRQKYEDGIFKEDKKAKADREDGGWGSDWSEE